MPLRDVEKSIKNDPRAPKGRFCRCDWPPGRSPHGSRVPGAAPIIKDVDKSIKTTTMVEDLTRRWAEGPAIFYVSLMCVLILKTYRNVFLIV